MIVLEEILSLEMINRAHTNVSIDTYLGPGHTNVSEVIYRGPGRRSMPYDFSVAKIGKNEGTVICKSLGYSGLERVVEARELFDQSNRAVAYNCDGTEERIEDCKMVDRKILRHSQMLGMGVVCKGRNKLGEMSFCLFHRILK